MPCLIKNPPLGDLPAREPESFSPLALGLSMRIDYARRQLVDGARAAGRRPTRPSCRCGCYRLATVRGTVNGQPGDFVVDTGGEVISISQATAGADAEPANLPAHSAEGLRHVGLGQGRVPDAGVDLVFDSIHFTKIPVVVLNLRAPSALLGFQLGGIVGHKFLSKYRVTIDLDAASSG